MAGFPSCTGDSLVIRDINRKENYFLFRCRDGLVVSQVTRGWAYIANYQSLLTSATEFNILTLNILEAGSLNSVTVRNIRDHDELIK